MIVDLFAGPGGWSTGLNMVGRAETIGIEWDKAACDTARAAGHERLQADIAKLDPFDVAGSDVEGLIGSPPCPGFSAAGLGLGKKDLLMLLAAIADIGSGKAPDDVLDTVRAAQHDMRSALTLEPLRWALALEPEWVALEQVPAVLPLWEACAEVLRADGYDVWTGLVQAETLGVPQARKRAILRARRGLLEPLTLTHSRYYARSKDKLDPGKLKWVSMAEALTAAGLAVPGDAVRSNYGTGGDASNRGERDATDPSATVTSHIGRNKWIYRSTTPTVNFAERSNKVEWMPAETAPDPKASGVRVTVQEAAILQSFPADYPWQDSKTAQYRQVGDAVPPLMAAHILASVGAGQLTKEIAA